jgi:hypothetical protein
MVRREMRLTGAGVGARMVYLGPELPDRLELVINMRTAKELVFEAEPVVRA